MGKLSRLSVVFISVAGLFVACLPDPKSKVANTGNATTDKCLDAVFRHGVVYDPSRNKAMRNRIPEQYRFKTSRGANGQHVFTINVSSKLKIELEHKDACKIMNDWGMSVGLSKRGRVAVGFAKESQVKVKDNFPIFFFASVSNNRGRIVRIAPVIDTPNNQTALEVFSVPVQPPADAPPDAPPLIDEGFFMNARDYVYFHSKEVDDFFALLTQRLSQPMQPFDPPGLTHYNKIIPQLRQMSGQHTVPLELKW